MCCLLFVLLNIYILVLVMFCLSFRCICFTMVFHLLSFVRSKIIFVIYKLYSGYSYILSMNTSVVDRPFTNCLFPYWHLTSISSHTTSGAGRPSALQTTSKTGVPSTTVVSDIKFIFGATVTVVPTKSFN